MLGDDHFYTNPACEYLRAAVRTHTQYGIVHDSTMAGRAVEVDQVDREIRLRTGMTELRYQTGLIRAGLYVIGGESWAPEFRTGARPRLSVVAPPPECPHCRTQLTGTD